MSASKEPKVMKAPRRKRLINNNPDKTPQTDSNNNGNSSPVVKKLPVIGPPVVFNEVQLKVAFSMLDSNQDGKVNGDELRDMLSRLGFKDVISDTLITALVNDATLNGDNLISEEQFLQWMPKLGLTGDVIEAKVKEVQRVESSNNTKLGDEEDAEKDLRAAFAVFDQDHNGFITRDELKEGMLLMGENLSERDLDNLLNETDTDKDGQINYEEFIRMLL